MELQLIDIAPKLDMTPLDLCAAAVRSKAKIWCRLAEVHLDGYSDAPLAAPHADFIVHPFTGWGAIHPDQPKASAEFCASFGDYVSLFASATEVVRDGWREVHRFATVKADDPAWQATTMEPAALAKFRAQNAHIADIGQQFFDAYMSGFLRANEEQSRGEMGVVGAEFADNRRGGVTVRREDLYLTRAGLLRVAENERWPAKLVAELAEAADAGLPANLPVWATIDAVAAMLGDSHPRRAPDLAAAVRAWIEVHMPQPSGVEKTQDHLKTNATRNFGVKAKGRLTAIATVATPIGKKR